MSKLSSDIISYTEARNNLKAVMNKVWDDAAPVTITHTGGKAVVVMSKEEYDSLAATEYLLASPANAQALRKSIAQVGRGKTVSMKLSKGKLTRGD